MQKARMLSKQVARQRSCLTLSLRYVRAACRDGRGNRSRETDIKRREGRFLSCVSPVFFSGGEGLDPKPRTLSRYEFPRRILPIVSFDLNLILPSPKDTHISRFSSPKVTRTSHVSSTIPGRPSPFDVEMNTSQIFFAERRPSHLQKNRRRRRRQFCLLLCLWLP